ncbi:hypothetical protein [Micromonospora sp. S-DT3-3-22]|uniref:hypothetical protein n=1 Tax=Micromonospora sp. S-DT3-3-22 TaxID=2755359 RepID=UPI00188EE860|nr:hypothetical protein [Micromonospora sp. S-DT3-3-22]
MPDTPAAVGGRPTIINLEMLRADRDMPPNLRPAGFIFMVKMGGIRPEGNDLHRLPHVPCMMSVVSHALACHDG